MFSFTVFTLLAVSCLLWAADPPQPDRTIGKEPAYGNKPQYCLLLFGLQADLRVWLVLDGNTLYVDKNGNGDLTEDGEKFQGKDQSFDVGTILSKDKRTEYRLSLESTTIKRVSRLFKIEVEVGGRYKQYTFLDLGEKPADQPREAPVRHFGGPMRLDLVQQEGRRLLRGELNPRPKRPGLDNDLAVGIHTPSAGGGWVYVYSEQHFPTDIHPVAEIAFPPKRFGDRPIVVKVPLTKRC